MQKIDTDVDGQISLEEFKVYFECRSAKSAKFAAKMQSKGKFSHDMLNEEDDEEASPATLLLEIIETTSCLSSCHDQLKQIKHTVNEAADIVCSALAELQSGQGDDEISKICRAAQESADRADQIRAESMQLHLTVSTWLVGQVCVLMVLCVDQ